jgi:hypothetical protein
MAVIGKINIGMGVNLAPFSKGLGRAADLVGGFGAKVGGAGVALSPLAKSADVAAASTSRLGAGLGGVAGKLAGLVSVGYLTSKVVGFTRASLNSADALNDQATQIGTTAGELAKLRYAAKLTGSETEALDGSLQKMTTVLGDAARQGGPAATTLAQLGLDANKLATLDPTVAFTKIAGAISQIPNPALQASAAVDIFGKSGVNILNTLRAGPEQLAAFSAEAQKLGLAVGEDQVAGIGKANDAFDRLGAVATGLGNSLAVAVAPYVTDIANGMVALAAQVQAGEGAFGAFASGVSGSIETVSMLARNFGDVWTIVQLNVTKFSANFLAAIDVIPENISRITTYLSENWANMLGDLAELQLTVFSNMLKNASAFGTAVWDAIQGKGFDPQFTKITDGYKALSKELPKLLEPAWVTMDDEFAAVGDHINKAEAIRDKALAAPAAPKKAAASEIRAEAPKLAGLAEMGSAAAYSSIVKFQGGQEAEPLKDMVKINKSQLDIQKQTLAAVQKSSGALPVYSMS